MSDGILNLTPDNRKAIWRTSRMLLWSLLATLSVGILFGINPFNFWDSPGHIVMVLGFWICIYHLLEGVRRRS